METQKTGLDAIQGKLKIAFVFALVIPAIVAFIFTEMQWYPATIIAEYMADEKGYFSLKSVVLMNTGVLLLGELVILLIILAIKQLFFRKK